MTGKRINPLWGLRMNKQRTPSVHCYCMFSSVHTYSGTSIPNAEMDVFNRTVADPWVINLATQKQDQSLVRFATGTLPCSSFIELTPM